MRPDYTPEEAYDWLTDLCSTAEYSTGEALERLARKGITGSEAYALVQRLVDQRYIDDERFARAYVRAKLAAGWGVAKIRSALYEKKVERDLMEAAIAQELDYDLYCRNLAAALRSKARSLPEELDAAARQKLARFAIGRGYEPSLVFEMLEDTDYWRSDEAL